MADQGGAPAEGAGGQAPAEAAPAVPAVDLSPIQETLGQINERMDRFEGRLPEQQQQAAPDPWDFTDVLGGQQQQQQQPDYGLEPEPQLDMQTILQRISEASQSTSQQQIQQALAPVLETIGNIQADTDAAYLIDAIPELADPEVAEATVRTADALAAHIGLSPQVARSAQFIEMVHKAQRFDQIARGEVPVGDLTHDTLETGGGAQPAQVPDTDIQQRILNAGGPRNNIWR